MLGLSSASSAASIAAALTLSLVTTSYAAVTPRKLGPSINTDAREIGVSASPDGRFLYITREDEPLTPVEAAAAAKARPKPKDTCTQLRELEQQMPGSMPADLLQRCATTGIETPKTAPSAPQPRQTPQRIFVAERGTDGEWGLARPLGLQSEGSRSTSIVTILPDNNTLVVLGDFPERGTDCARGPGQKPKPGASCAPYWLVQRRGSGWAAPRRLDIAFATQATRTTATVLPNLQAMLLDMKRDNGRGGRDLYYAAATSESSFAAPINLGPQINTPANEAAASLAADGKTLYFASDRAGGTGGFDLYVTRRLDDSWQKWSTPRNLGPGINTARDEASITVDASGQFAYLISTDPKSLEDIFEFALPPELRPEPVAFVFGTVRDPAGKAVPAGISYDRLADGRFEGRASADLETGSYQIALPVGTHYGFRAVAAGYAAVADRIDLRGAAIEARYRRDLLLIPLEAGRTIRLNNLFFEMNAAELLPESKSELDRLVALMAANARLQIRIEAHTDAVGSDSANLALSSARAAAVARFLAAARVDPSRVESRGFGETAPASSNDTEQGRALNRRVEFRVLSL
mgnify:CR=1 FL=1